MSESTGTKQIRCQFTLNVDTNPAHDYALVVLRQWLKQQTQCNPGDENALAVSDFNRQIYLSGLFLHLLDSDLPAKLAEGFGPTQIQLSTLCHHLNLMPRSEAGESQHELQPQMQQLLQQQAQMQQQNQQLLKQLSAMQRQLQKLQLKGVAANSADSAEGDEDEGNTFDMADTMAKVANVKAKGLW